MYISTSIHIFIHKSTELSDSATPLSRLTPPCVTWLIQISKFYVCAFFFSFAPQAFYGLFLYVGQKQSERERGGGDIFAVQRRFNAFPYVNGPHLLMWHFGLENTKTRTKSSLLFDISISVVQSAFTCAFQTLQQQMRSLINFNSVALLCIWQLD